jgi:asparagine synthase (glutamine-hydrolysing)
MAPSHASPSPVAHPADGQAGSGTIQQEGVRVHHWGCTAFSGTAVTPATVLVTGRLLHPEADPTAPATPGAQVEAVARAFLERGPAMFRDLDGEFALTILDHRTDRVYLVRDRVGTRPCFWAHTADGGVAWASECKMLLPLLARRRLDEVGLAEVLQFRWLAGDRTLFAGIQRILPGSWVLLERQRDRVTVHAELYWRFEAVPEAADRPLSAWVDEADVALGSAVRRRVSGARSAAVLLSGGVDSPVLSQYVKRWMDDYVLVSPTWKGFDDPEIPRAAEYGRLIGGDHRVVVMDPDALEDDFVLLNRRFEQPARSPHALTLARLAGELHDFDLLVHGEGADAMFGADGLRLVRNFSRKRRWIEPFGPLPRWLGAAIPPLAGRPRRLKQVLTRTTWDVVRLMGDAEHEPWLLRRWTAQGLGFDANPVLLASFVTHSPDLMARRQYIGLYTAVQDHVEMLDRLFATTPIHVITPLLSPEIFDLACRLPREYKLDGAGRAKPVLKELNARHFPVPLANATKLGFPAPTLAWLEGTLRARVQRLQRGRTPSAELFGGDLVGRLSLPRDLQAVWTLVCLDEILMSFDVEPATAAG